VCLRGDAFGFLELVVEARHFVFKNLRTFANLDWDITTGFASHLDLIWLDNRPRTDPAHT
jgi:hypothetical protein